MLFKFEVARISLKEQPIASMGWAQCYVTIVISRTSELWSHKFEQNWLCCKYVAVLAADIN